MKKPQFLTRSAPAADVRQNRQRALKNGAYATVLGAAVLAVLVLLNLVVDAIPSQYTKIDISTGGLFTLTETTKNLLAEMDRDVTAYYLGITGEEDDNITQLLDRYAGQTGHFRWQQKDPNLYPNFAQQYASASASVGSVILVCGENFTLVDYWSMYEFDYSNYYTTGSTSYSFAAENALTTGLAAVLRTELHPLYALTGHGELTLPDDYVQTLQNSGVAVQSLNLTAVGDIPEDAEVLFINAPQTDLSEQDAATVLTWLQNGGRVLAVTDFLADTPNLDALLAEYGMFRQPGVLVEQDMDYYLYNYPQIYLLPEVNYNEVTASMAQGMFTITPVSQGILVSGETTYDYYPLLSTTANSFSLIDWLTAETMTQTENDPDGPFDLAVAMYDGVNSTKLVWLNCANMLDSDADQVVSGGNAQFLGSVVNWLCDQEAAAIIDSKSMSGALLDVPVTMAVLLGLLFVIMLPVGCLVAGAVYCLLRRRR